MKTMFLILLSIITDFCAFYLLIIWLIFIFCFSVFIWLYMSYLSAKHIVLLQWLVD